MTSRYDSEGQFELEQDLRRTYRECLGQDLIPGEGDLSVYRADRVVLCHDGADDPCFIYANEAAQQLWKMSWDEMIGMPSRLSAIPEAREERAEQLRRAARDGFVRDYSGIRVASDQTRFEIRNVVIWTVTDQTGAVIGQAATFTDWSVISE